MCILQFKPPTCQKRNNSAIPNFEQSCSDFPDTQIHVYRLQNFSKLFYSNHRKFIKILIQKPTAIPNKLMENVFYLKSPFSLENI